MQAVYDRVVGSDFEPVSAFILAGGNSSRMGKDKGFVEFHGRTLLARALEAAWSVTADTRIVGGAAKFGNHGPVVEDVFPDCGPLGGIHAALRASSNDLNLVLAVDMPLVSGELLQYLISRARGANAIVTVPRTQSGWQPLCAVYRREFADPAESALKSRRYKIDPLFDRVTVLPVKEAELAGAGFSADLFCNLNTRQDLENAMKNQRRPRV